ncbi:hypothetical protein E2C01_067919 [Portunus trituberculatus]|uniref:Uncharacterized protein n=1 Tax=Portunus trituberculatus TaxID=210409 RepID=A0A5B7HUX6_PORTR|nr:hypothetical protein [Portunus trituberculatus]
MRRSVFPAASSRIDETRCKQDTRARFPATTDKTYDCGDAKRTHGQQVDKDVVWCRKFHPRAAAPRSTKKLSWRRRTVFPGVFCGAPPPPPRLARLFRPITCTMII